MSDLVTLTIDGREVSVPPGTLIVDAAREIGIDIPVFCYHPKMEPVGMCRMCLVEIGRPVIDRATGEFQKDETGKPQITFGPKLETACTTPVSPGMVVCGLTDKVREGRKDVIEFLLTSHPLDCPICDKGGECPLQNLTMAFGPGQSRYLYDEKIHLAKHYPLGELITLDRERCIQCGRCVRFQDEIVDDPVIGFYQRGRALEIVTFSEPGFDSYFSGNTTDICPVGALTATDFRFRARPWEMNTAASICPHCPVGCNLTINVRREAASGGDTVIKRIMPRQNEAVNEIWICDKGRWGYHYTHSPDRLRQPLVRQGDDLVPATWEAALGRVAAALDSPGNGQTAGSLPAGRRPAFIAGGRLSNEDLFNLGQLAQRDSGQRLLYTTMGGGDVVSRLGLAPGSNLKDAGKGTAILVIACDLEEEAPLWWLRIKQAAERGATLIVANPRQTKLDRVATHVLRYAYGDEVSTLQGFLPGKGRNSSFAAVAEAFASAENAIVLYGQEGMDLATSQALAEAAGQLLEATGHTGPVPNGRPNNGLIAAWPNGNTQGAWEVGFRPAADWAAVLSSAGFVYLAAADPVGDDPRLADALRQADFVLVQDLFLTETARLADVVLPALPFPFREGTYTSGERRVQRFYPAVPRRDPARPDFTITAQIAARLGLALEGRSARGVFDQLARAVPAFRELTYDRISEVSVQHPLMGREDLYYAGTSYENQQGLGATLALAPAGAPTEMEIPAAEPASLPAPDPQNGIFLAVPVTRLYDRGQTLLPSEILHGRLAGPIIVLHPEDAARLGLAESSAARVHLNGVSAGVSVAVDESLASGIALVLRSVGLPVFGPTRMQVEPQPVMAGGATSGAASEG